MYPILGRFGPFFLYSFHVVMALGLLATIGFTYWYSRPRSLQWLDGLLVSLAAGLVGGRLTFVVANWDYYQQQPAEIPLLWQGGLSYHGTLLTALLVLWLWSKLPTLTIRLPHLVTLSPCHPVTPLALALPLAHTFGWFACYLEGCAYGREAPPGLFAADLPDSYGVFALRYQTQLIGLALSLLTFLLITYLYRRSPTAPLFWLSLALLSLGRIPLSLLRADPVPFIGPIRLDTLLDSTITLLAFFLFLFSAPSRSYAGAVRHPESK